MDKAKGGGSVGFFCILEPEGQLMSETRGRLSKPREGFEANIEVDIGIRSMFNKFAQAHTD